MQSGLAFSEKYSEPLGDVTKMLFAQPDASRFAASKPLQYQINTHWSYSSGTTNILCRMIRNIVGEEKYWTFPQEFLFNTTGMHSIIEVDANGTFIGSSFGWMTARDWARFGQLFLNRVSGMEVNYYQRDGSNTQQHLHQKRKGVMAHTGG